MQQAARRPVWSGGFTTRLAAFIPVRRRAAALAAIKALHTIIFASVGGAIGLFVWDGLRQRHGRRAAIALGIVLTESALYVSNNQVCPLTPLAEELGAERGSVADIFLPGWVARRIPLFGGSALAIGLVLNLWAWVSHRANRAQVAPGYCPPNPSSLVSSTGGRPRSRRCFSSQSIETALMSSRVRKIFC